jgi:hypothetical protein
MFRSGTGGPVPDRCHHINMGRDDEVESKSDGSDEAEAA